MNELLPDRLSNTITTINHNGMSSISSPGIASALNYFFANIGTKHSNKFSSFSYDFTQYLQRPSSSSFNQIEISQEFVRGELGRLKLNKATCLDKVSVRLLKDSMDIITPSLTYLLNMSKCYLEKW